jgi:phospholipase/carboxylesterase
MMLQYTDCPEVRSKNGDPGKLVVFIHGLGSDGYDLISLAPFFQYEFPGYHFISPHGVEEFDMAPFGRQWFSVLDRDESLVKTLVKKNGPLLSSIIKDKQAELNLKNKDTILIGFSQGTMIGLYLTLTQDDPFYAMVGFSGKLIKPDQCQNNKTPVCVIHGQEDDVVPIRELTIIEDYLLNNNVQYNTYTIPNLAHSIDDRGIDFAIKFLKGIS